MPLTKPALPPGFNYGEWRKLPRMARIKPMVLDWAQSGFGAPDLVYLIYIIKIPLYILGAIGFVVLTPGIGSLGDISSWWTEPVVFQKVVIWTLLFEVLGFGCGFGPLSNRFSPPLGTFLYWLRPGTIRMPPWPGKVPGTKGTTRTVFDTVLYAGVLATAVFALVSPASRGSGNLDTALGLLPVERVLPLLIVLAIIGLRDKTIFLAARSEVYGALAVTFLFSGVDFVVGSQLILLMVWLGAASSKLTKHFPYVVSVMMTNNPLIRSQAVRRRFFRNFPTDIRPSKLSSFIAHSGTVVEFVVPVVLFLSDGGPVTMIAVAIMLVFHLNIIVSMPMGVPLEWNVFMMYGAVAMFAGHNAQYGLSDVTHWWPIIALMLVSAGSVVWGNFAPEKFSFLTSMRYYAGNWANSSWCFTPSAVAKWEHNVKKSGPLPRAQLVNRYGEEMTEVLVAKTWAFRAMHPQGRALFGLIPRACGPNHETDYDIVDGENVTGPTLGWNFGDGHLNNEQLIEALQEICHFEPGELRVIILESQPMHTGSQQYRLIDAATGEFERGYVRVADQLARQPWDVDDLPVYNVTRQAAGAPAQ